MYIYIYIYIYITNSSVFWALYLFIITLSIVYSHQTQKAIRMKSILLFKTYFYLHFYIIASLFLTLQVFFIFLFVF